MTLEQKRLWTDFYKIGLQLWMTPSRPEILDRLDQPILNIHGYAYRFAVLCFEDVETWWSPWKTDNG
jgi:hypothetical protein